MTGKFLFYRCGKPVYEGDETHQVLEEFRKAKEKGFKGTETEFFAQKARKHIKEIQKFFNKQ